MEPTTLRDWFELYVAKAPVNHEGPQRQALKALRVLEPHLTLEERRALGVAQSHATLCGEGRGEFDRIADMVRRRMF